MSLSLYNTIAGEKQLFVPLRPGRVGIYVCGPTVYDHAHLGHARSAVAFDVLARYLKFRGMQVTYVRNFTDIDDKIIERCEQMNIEPAELAEMHINSYREDMEALNVQSPDYEPRVTEYMGPICAMIKKLIEKRHAYVLKDSVLFRVNRLCDYGVLSGVPARDKTAARFRVSSKISKECDRDFVLWKNTPDSAYGWDSPWGRGRPGWHIECVAMSRAFLGDLFDIHGGGSDLVFPHHENEISISRSHAGSDLARYWMHHGLVTAGGKKLSKSGDFPVRIRDLCLRYHPEAVRLFLLTTHYRRPIDFSDHHINAAASALDRLYAFLGRCRGIGVPADRDVVAENSFHARFCQAADEDLNISKGISLLFACVRQMNRRMDDAGGLGDLCDRDITMISEMVMICRNVLGIFRDSFDQYKEKRQEYPLSVCA